MPSQRVLLSLDQDVYERIRVFAFQTRVSIPAIIRQCIDAQLDNIELKVLATNPSLRSFAESAPRTMLNENLLRTHIKADDATNDPPKPRDDPQK